MPQKPVDKVGDSDSPSSYSHPSRQKCQTQIPAIFIEKMQKCARSWLFTKKVAQRLNQAERYACWRYGAEAVRPMVMQP